MLHLLPTTKWLLYSLILAAGFLRFAQARASDFFFILPMTDLQKEQWVDAHNYLRRGLNAPEAANMRLMTWDDELAELAESVVRTCNFVHTSTIGMQTSAFPEAGENLYAGSEYRFSEMMTRDGITKYWYDEIEFYSHDTLTCEPDKMCGHYTQVIWSTTFKVGCAIASCAAVENGFGTLLVGCNYGPAGNHFLYGSAVAPYIEGEACSECDQGDLCIDQLCNNTARDVPFTTTTPEATTATTSPVTSAATTLAETTTATNPAATTSPVTLAVSTAPQTSVGIEENSVTELCSDGQCVTVRVASLTTYSVSSVIPTNHSYIAALFVIFFVLFALIFSFLLCPWVITKWRKLY